MGKCLYLVSEDRDYIERVDDGYWDFENPEAEIRIVVERDVNKDQIPYIKAKGRIKYELTPNGLVAHVYATEQC